MIALRHVCFWKPSRMFIKQNINVNALGKCWLLFMVCLAIARYPLAVCFILSFIGGVAAGLLSQWWQLTKMPDTTEPDKKSRLPKPVEALRQRIQSLGSQQRTSRTKNPAQPRVGLFGRTYPRESMRSRPRRTSKRRSRQTSEE